MDRQRSVVDTPARQERRTLLQRDAGLVWHPYAPVDAGAHYAVRAAEAARLTLEGPDGATCEVVDGMSSWWSAIHGYRHPVLDAAARDQLDIFSHVMFGGLTHEPAVALAERLVAMTPVGLRHVFLADSGSISVEVALKLALQVQAARGEPQRQRFLALRGGYHGDTFATMGVCDPEDGMHAEFSGLVPRQAFLPRPPAGRLGANGAWEYDDGALTAWEAQTRNVAEGLAPELAGIVCEPVLQGAGGMYAYPPAVVGILRQIADDHGLLLILDEIATGFGRTGRFFASEWAETTDGQAVVPDILCVGKALTGGYLTLAAMLCTAAVADALGAGPNGGALLHGPTFMGNPLACSIAVASLDLLTGGPGGSLPAVGAEPGQADPAGARPPWQVQVETLQARLRTELAPSRELSCVRDVRVLGGVGVVQLDGPVDVAAVTREVVDRGAWVRPFRDLVYVMPPYVSTAEDLRTLGAAIIEGVARVHD
ncbi:aminotransferase class III-fold pyridoxal phosphate-dependent enzyme [Nesterenkonia sphaerica]|uniref:Adenosylmethionine-8-amino-7-oxononanoate aminotransferase n=1 Tax=Nesterenkonia sphaerica TaxID=1804988 RepID=A0A5R8ZXM1_9MICC|nr:aminotransferase class III-fold pyridoxal phosphate-dependent enzyme [Nesterenkonia sphaerica]TLP71183.1 aminotransferase class III-fold pyridoxal phosphate-dependent enzyme [Nesterenkonia sphaerica]